MATATRVPARLGLQPPSVRPSSRGYAAEERPEREARNERNRVAGSTRSSSRSSRSRYPEKDREPEAEEMLEERKRDSRGVLTTVHQYRKGRLLGKGGFARCYLARCLSDDVDYALKVVSKSTLTKSRAKQKLQAEIKIHRTLRHRHVVRFERFFEDSRNAYILLELAPNGSLSEMVKRRKRLTEREMQLLMLQLIDGVRYMHRVGVIHRDLKLGNIFLDEHMSVKIGDLGLAAQVSSSSEQRRTICGTPNYIAPEILDNKAGHSFQVDIWSMGVILYTCLVGRPPYESRDVKSTYKRILANLYTFPEHVHISDAAKSLIRRMLQTQPDSRPSLAEIRAHPFFTESPQSIPAILPASARRYMPVFDASGSCLSHPTPSLPGPSRSPENLGRTTSATGVNRRPLEVKPGATPSPLKLAHNAGLKRRPLAALAGTHQENAATMKPRRSIGKSEGPVRAFKVFDESSTPQAPGVSTKPRTARASPSPTFPILARESSDRAPLHGGPGGPGGRRKTSDRRRNDENADPKRSPQLAAAGASNPLRTPVMERQAPQVVKDCGTLETMHKALERSFTAGVGTGAARALQLSSPGPFAGEAESCGPRVWVSRFVDYTSKYGLGFRLNTGSSGVYFNDSTKIVLAPGSQRFAYVERRRSTARGSEHLATYYSMASFPSELQKKVTLLKHFHSYLLDQERSHGGATAVEDTQRSPHVAQSRAEGAQEELVFLKKWVRTRHAILFRLSNKTVQVVFFDQSEVLLSAGGTHVTYLDKQGGRQTLTLAEVMDKGRADISKRLKYAKDILAQLIAGTSTAKDVKTPRGGKR